jgi:hypothetical protein
LLVFKPSSTSLQGEKDHPFTEFSTSSATDGLAANDGGWCVAEHVIACWHEAARANQKGSNLHQQVKGNSTEGHQKCSIPFLAQIQIELTTTTRCGNASYRHLKQLGSKVGGEKSVSNWSYRWAC